MDLVALDVTVSLQRRNRKVVLISCRLSMPLCCSPGNVLSVIALLLCFAIVVTLAHLAREWKQVAMLLSKEAAEGWVSRE